MKDFARLGAIAVTLLGHGVASFVPAAWSAPGWFRLAARAVPQRHAALSRGARLRLALESLGPIFVKFGQVLSTRRDLMAPDVADELARLQDRVPPFEGHEARLIIERALGQPLTQLFAQFDDQPVASASIAQVHFARLPSGQDVAVKVLRPGMLAAIDRDLSLLRRLAAWVERLSPDGRRLRPSDVVREFDGYLHDELDLLREAANAAQLQRNMQGLNLVQVPSMVWSHCTTDVLVMERMQGVPIAQVDRLVAAGVNLKQLAQDGVTIFFTQVFRDGFFHADMHPGNILVSTAPATLGRYVALDFGIVGTLSEHDKQYLAHNFVAFFRRDYKRVAQLHVESGWVPSDTRVDQLEAAVRAVCEPQFQRPLKDISLGLVLMRLFQASRRFNVDIQPQLVLLQKTLLNVEGLGRQLDPELDLWATAQPFLERWVKDQVGLPALLHHLQQEAPRYAELLPQLPRLLHQALSTQAKQVPAAGSMASLAGLHERAQSQGPSGQPSPSRWHWVGYAITGVLAALLGAVVGAWTLLALFQAA